MCAFEKKNFFFLDIFLDNQQLIFFVLCLYFHIYFQNVRAIRSAAGPPVDL